MEEKIDFEKVPYQYAMCLNRECSKANTCLRQLTAQSAPEKIEYWVIVSPKHLAAQQGNCPYYRSNAKVRYAKGIRLPVVVFDVCIKLLRGGDTAVLEDIQYVLLFGGREKAFAFA